MVELPEGYVLARELNEAVAGKTIVKTIVNQNPHGFAWLTGDQAHYDELLLGKAIDRAEVGGRYTCGGNVEVYVGDDTLLVFSTPLKYFEAGQKLPKKHQLLLEFDDGSVLTSTVQMWGAMFVFPLDDVKMPKDFEVKYAPSPLDDQFDKEYFDSLKTKDTDKLSAKAFLATGQRIPGLGNGILQDILYTAGIHPRRKMKDVSVEEYDRLFHAVKDIMARAVDEGGRDTEKDLFGQKGGYETILSKNTLGKPCKRCGTKIKKESYMGGTIYFCEKCQS